jgi:hypothetical protein
MQRFFRLALIFSIIAAFLVTACRVPEPVDNFDELLDRLRQAEAAVEVSTRTGSSLHLSVVGRLITVNKENVLVFEYEDVAKAKTEANALTSRPGLVFFEEGQTGATEILSGRKHYYRSGRFILSYAGKNEMVFQPIEEVFGTPFEIQ